MATDPNTAATDANAADKTAQDEAPIRTKKAKKAAVRNPVQHVHFSSFIIQ